MEKTKNSGKLNLDHCFMNASGVKCRTGKIYVICIEVKLELVLLFVKVAQMILEVIKELLIIITEAMSINSSGLPNYGYNFYTNMGKEVERL